MRKINLRMPIVLFALIAVIALVSCSKNSDYGTNPNNSGGNNMGDSSISISGFKFSPAPLRVKAGTTVTWTNKDSAPHTVTSDNGAFTSSGNLNQNNFYAFKFVTAGTFPYHCSIHPSMTGSVIVTQ